MRYRLLPREGTCTFHKIMSGRRWVGRVYQHADGTWSAAIGKVELSRQPTPEAAFDEGVAKHLGYASAAALRQRNADVRHAMAVRRRMRSSMVRAAMNQEGSHMKIKYPKVKVKLTGTDGNAFAVIGKVNRALAAAGVGKSERDAFMKEATSGDYDNVLGTAMRWVDVS